MCLDLATDKLLWERKYDAGLRPHGDHARRQDDLSAVAGRAATGTSSTAESGERGRTKLSPNSGAHNTICRPVGQARLPGRAEVAAAARGRYANPRWSQSVGPFAASIRPFTVNGRETLLLRQRQRLLGFEVGDLTTGEKLHRVDVQGFEKGPTKRHGCPSHGIGLTPDEKEIWLTDAANSRCTFSTPRSCRRSKSKASSSAISPAGSRSASTASYAYPSTGDVIEQPDAQDRGPSDRRGGAGRAKREMVEVHLRDREVVRLGNQFGIGRATS